MRFCRLAVSIQKKPHTKVAKTAKQKDGKAIQQKLDVKAQALLRTAGIAFVSIRM